jgi:hypothetical protein
MLNPLTALWKWLCKPNTPSEREMTREIAPRLSCNEIILAQRAIAGLEKKGYLHAKEARVDRVANHIYLVFPSNEDPTNKEVEIQLY